MKWRILERWYIEDEGSKRMQWHGTYLSYRLARFHTLMKIRAATVEDEFGTYNWTWTPTFTFKRVP